MRSASSTHLCFSIAAVLTLASSASIAQEKQELSANNRVTLAFENVGLRVVNWTNGTVPGIGPVTVSCSKQGGAYSKQSDNAFTGMMSDSHDQAIIVDSTEKEPPEFMEGLSTSYPHKVLADENTVKRWNEIVISLCRTFLRVAGNHAANSYSVAYEGGQLSVDEQRKPSPESPAGEYGLLPAYQQSLGGLLSTPFALDPK